MRLPVLKCGLIEKNAIAPFAILSGTDFRLRVLGRICSLDSARSRSLESEAVGRLLKGP